MYLGNLNDSFSLFSRKLINLLESFKQIGLVSEKKQSGSKKEVKESNISGSGGNGMVYELYYAPEHARLNQLASVAELEKKIDRIETLVGNNPDKLVRAATFIFIITCLCKETFLFNIYLNSASSLTLTCICGKGQALKVNLHF